MQYLRSIALLLVLLLSWPNDGYAQAPIVLDDCGVSYVDPQDQSDIPSSGLDTLIYSELFSEQGFRHSYFIDINAFGGQQVDRSRVYAILPGNSRLLLGELAFGNCIDCVRGFALVYNDSLLVQEVDDVQLMDRWLQSLNQPPYALPGNLQTLAGVGRLSGEVPPCAIGLYVEYIINSNPQSTSTEFSTHIICPQIVQDCRIEARAVIDCRQDSLFLEAVLPPDCFSEPPPLIRWSDDRGWSSSEPNPARALSGNKGWYYLEVNDGFCVLTDTVLVESPTVADAGSDVEVCRDEAVVLQGSGGERQYWELPSGQEADGARFEIARAQAGDSGPYVLHAFNEDECEATDTLLLRVNTPPTPQIEITDACLGDTLLIELLNDSLYAQTTWLDPAGRSFAPPLIPDLQPEDFGQYTLVATDLEGCEIREAFEVSGSLPPAVEYTVEEGCDSTRVYVFPDSYQYEWEDGTTGSYYASATGGTVELTITDETGCRTALAIELPFPDGPQIDLAITQPACPGDYGVVEVLVDERDPFIFSIDGGESYDVQSTFDRLTYGDYQLLVQDALGCEQSFPIEILQPDTVGVSLPEQHLIERPLTPILLTARTVGEVETIQWLPESIDSGSEVTEFITSTDMDIRVIVRDNRGCIASAALRLDIVLGDIYAPNAFSPNGDGFNDYFTLFSDNGSGEVIEQLTVYDRWGGMVFEATEIGLNDEALGWNGRRDGKTLEPGVFTYFGIIRFGNGARREIKGDVTLLR